MSFLKTTGLELGRMHNVYRYSVKKSMTAVQSFNFGCHFHNGNRFTALPASNLRPILDSSKNTGNKKSLKPITTHIGGDKDVIFRQFIDYKSFTYTYLLADTRTREAILIDPVIEMVDRDIQIATELRLTLKYAANTHVHADHITGTGEIKKRITNCQSMIADVGKATADIKLVEGDLIKFGNQELEVRSTPGHTNGCISFVWHDKKMVFTGDAVLIRGCGRTDFQQGDPGILYDSVHKKIFSLPSDFMIFPAHDYTGKTSSTVGEEVQHNPRLAKNREEFIEIMKNLKLPYPKQIDRALPANMICGISD